VIAMTATRNAHALIFGSVDEFFDTLFGPAQHDAHVECWRGNKWLTSREAENAAANLRVAKLVDEMIREKAWRRPLYPLSEAAE
jgi:hypothetical protein